MRMSPRRHRPAGGTALAVVPAVVGALLSHAGTNLLGPALLVLPVLLLVVYRFLLRRCTGDRIVPVLC